MTEILVYIFVFAFGGVIGAALVLWYLDKSMNDLIASYNSLVETQRDVIKLDDEIIKSYKDIVNGQQFAIGKTYSTLVGLRDGGTENLDEIIGYLGEHLDDHKEESE